MSDYEAFLVSKMRQIPAAGFDPGEDAINPDLFGFERALVRWACRRGRAGLFADTGLGKTIMQLEWARLVTEHECASALIFAPLAVAEQTVREGAAHGIPVRYVRSQAEMDWERGPDDRIWITNYEMRDRFDMASFDAVVLDESSILKSQDGKTRTALIESCASVPYRLSCTATPSPNDFMELSNQSEFLGAMTRAEMLAMFFTHDGGDTSKWRLKNHGRMDFWRWMSSWAAVVRRPSDLGFDDDGYILPPLRMHEHIVRSDDMITDELFPRAAMTLTEQRQAQRASLTDRVAECAGRVNAENERWIVWCHLNDESAALARSIEGAVEVRGSDALESKRDALDRFSCGEIRVLVTKPSIAGFGMNWQHCNRMAFVGLSHSFEQLYQAVRRCWRFGQKREVLVDIVASEGERGVLANLQRKAGQADRMFSSLVDEMNNAASVVIDDGDESAHGTQQIH